MRYICANLKQQALAALSKRTANFANYNQEEFVADLVSERAHIETGSGGGDKRPIGLMYAGSLMRTTML